ncbi:molybdopterin molybdotransferase MoeA [Maridesulfovibrio ferrireducens]|uniref:molybdopterin molybdotransferase MoeA n=1 Tax=Maridesulfovibrio ferrireducens TaxID=246191 RepID=UPI001A33FD4E|nr:molybdopterin molybdotransferase MoeA [Maridesulfovibrio ferrireducens]MBI9110779.1 molybdopterin molybdotransferase MoeA [Maridesulfovibrio ferrireducens]
MQQDLEKNANYPQNITRQKALEILKTQLSPIIEKTIPVIDCCGSVAAQTICSEISMPEHDRSAMDGFALTASETSSASVDSPIVFTVSGEIRPSSSGSEKTRPNGAIKILTGGIIPQGCDSVIPFEQVTVSSNKISIFSPVQEGNFIRPAGSDVLPGETLIAENTYISACAAALLAYAGKNHIRVRQAPSIAVLAVGNELCDPTKTGPEGLIPADNLILMKALCESCGTAEVSISTCENSPEAIAEAIKKHSACDLIITTGGTGPGNRDFVFDSICNAGGTPLFKGLSIHPAKSIFAFKLQDTAILGLPGPPNAVQLAFHTVIKPTLNILLGLPDIISSTFAILGASVKGAEEREKLILCYIIEENGSIKATPLNNRNLSSRKLMCLANGIITIAPNSGKLNAGELVKIIKTG